MNASLQERGINHRQLKGSKCLQLKGFKLLQKRDSKRRQQKGFKRRPTNQTSSLLKSMTRESATYWALKTKRWKAVISGVLCALKCATLRAFSTTTRQGYILFHLPPPPHQAWKNPSSMAPGMPRFLELAGNFLISQGIFVKCSGCRGLQSIFLTYRVF